jgi:hypothetical protein
MVRPAAFRRPEEDITMGEIFHALEVLNRSMKLGLTGQQLLRAEMGFKSALAMQGNPAAAQLAGDPARLAESYELKATLRPRSAKVPLNQLSRFAGLAVRQPHTRVDAATFRRIDNAMAAASINIAAIGATHAIVRRGAAKKGAASAPKRVRKSR